MVSAMNERDILQTVPIFSCLEESERATLCERAIRKRIPKNAILLNQGDTTDSLYIILSGKVKTIIEDENGKEIILSISGVGEYFGEMAMIDEEPRSATIMTKEPTEVMIFTRPVVRQILAEHLDTAFSLLRGLTHRLREANKQIESLAFMDVYGRVSRLFNDQSDAINGEWVVNEPLTHQEIANMVGASREMVTRIMRELTDGGYLSTEKKTITIHKKLPYSW